MTTQPQLHKEHDGVVQSPITILSTVPWWTGLGTQLAPYGESFGHLKSAKAEQVPKRNQQSSTKQGECRPGKVLRDGNKARVPTCPGDTESHHCKTSANGQKLPQHQNATYVKAASVEHGGLFELGFCQPTICAKYPSGEQFYGLYPPYGPQVTDRIMLPLSLTPDEGPIFVNAKQYRGILRRRQSRAKAEAGNKMVQQRKRFMHLSRHLHAIRRPRGNGGRFLNTKDLNDGKDKKGAAQTSERQNYNCSGGLNFMAMQSDSANLSSLKTSGSMSSASSSEAASIYKRDDLDLFPVDHFNASVTSLSDMMHAGHHIAASKWVAAADGGCNPRAC